MLWWRFEFVNGAEDGEVSVVYKATDEFEVEGVPPWRRKSLRAFTLKLTVALNNVDPLNQTSCYTTLVVFVCPGTKTSSSSTRRLRGLYERNVLPIKISEV